MEEMILPQKMKQTAYIWKQNAMWYWRVKTMQTNQNQKKRFTWKKQVEVLKYIIEQQMSFPEYLKNNNFDYDDLVYKNYENAEHRKSKHFVLNDFKHKENKIPVVSFFSGAGGLDLGFESAGFSHIALFEVNELFCKTLKHNRPLWDVLCADISKTDEVITLLTNKIGTSDCFSGIFVGGPPCQPFSIAANQRFSKSSDNFKRIGFSNKKNGNLLFDYIQLINYFKPEVFIIENVVGLIDVDGGEQLAKAYKKLENNGYYIEQPLIFRAESYYVPQQRVRLIIIGNRKGKQYILPQRSSQPMNVSGIFDLPLSSAKNHITREHNAESILRYMVLDYGQRDKLGRVDRLNPSLPSKTVIAGGVSGGGRSHLHPYIPRTLSVRECARIQTFPEDYEFLGSVARQFTQVGNAVPPILAAQIAHSIYVSFFQ
jgi:DNA (cytosine-5)-methyltransferase 1